MPIYKVVATLPAASGFAEDAVQNTFIVNSTDPILDANVGIVSMPLHNFYDIATPFGQRISGKLARSIDRAMLSGEIRVYDITDHLDGSDHGSPVAVDSFTLDAAQAPTDGLPSELSVTLTLRALGWQEAMVEAPDDADAGPEVNRPRQRHSGRLYLGPWTTAAAVTDAASPFNVKVSPDLVTTILEAAERLRDELVANACDWVVWSRKDGGVRNITHVQVDNAFDVQRRRGINATQRTTVTVSP